MDKQLKHDLAVTLTQKIMKWRGVQGVQATITQLSMIEAAMDFIIIGTSQFLESIADNIIYAGLMAVAYLAALQSIGYQYAAQDLNSLVGGIWAISFTFMLVQLFLQLQHDYPLGEGIENRISMVMAIMTASLTGQVFLLLVIAKFVIGTTAPLFTPQIMTPFFGLWVAYLFGAMVVDMFDRLNDEETTWRTILRGMAGGAISFLSIALAISALAWQIPDVSNLLGYGLASLFFSAIMVTILAECFIIALRIGSDKLSNYLILRFRLSQNKPN